MDDQKEVVDVSAAYVGVEVSYTDGRDQIPVQVKEVPFEKGLGWLKKEYESEWPLRVLSCQLDGFREASPFRQDIISIASPGDGSDYATLYETEGGGSNAFVGYPSTIIAQTPRDGGPFCSLAMTTTSWRKGIVCGIYHYDDPKFDPARILKGCKLYSGWRSDGWQVMVLPIAFLLAHTRHQAQEIAHLNKRILGLEDILTQLRDPDDNTLDFGAMTRQLHDCSSELVRLERRAHFGSGMARNLEEMVNSIKKEGGSTGIFDLLLHPIKLAANMMQTQSYDLESLPKRLENQRTLVFNLIVQRDSRLNLQIGRTNMEIAETSRRIAEASMRDSASMKTIAILTMVFLPGTAVASFFSMTMFNWEAGPDQTLASSYVWIYFVTSIPLTIIVLLIWWASIRRRRATRAMRIQSDLYKTDDGTRHNVAHSSLRRR